MKRWKLTLIFGILGAVWIIGFYGFYIPNYLETHQDEQKEVIEMSGLTPIEQTEVSGLSGTATWTVSELDSLGNPVEKIVDVRLSKGNWTVQPH